ncbi:hypothetical protein BX666DRAFT_1861516 [Dichotomocladium elegans]|nr:hypothetical protein BX666DRAFT_1861516 [Dichotomocladium elegans]
MYNYPAEIHIPDADSSVEDAESEPTTPIPSRLSSDEERPARNHSPVHEESQQQLPTIDQLQQQTRIDLPEDKNMADFVTPPTPGAPPSTFKDDDLHEQSLDDPPSKIPTNQKNGIPPNTLSPRDQEYADETMLRGIHAFFNNNFNEAEVAFRSQSDEDPLYALGLGTMAFIKDGESSEDAITQLTATFQFATAQIDAASAKKPLKDTVSHYLTNLMGTNTTGLPTNTSPLSHEAMEKKPDFMSNGALRAHVIRSECCLLMAMVYLSQESAVGYLKAGLNLRRAYSSYSLVWQEYKRMGQEFNTFMDKNTISAIQFGIGSVHLVLSSLPPKILKIISAFGWNADKHLGFALLQLCMDGQRIRSPLAAMMLLMYYVTLMTYCPQILTRVMLQPAIEVLLEAQKTFPNSALFLYFAGRISRLSRNIPLSQQSFLYTYKVSQGAAWAETTVGHLATHEMALNCVVDLDWASAALRTVELQGRYGSAAFNKYFYGTCMEMLGNRSEAILAFAETTTLFGSKKSQEEQFVAHRITFFEKSGYQDMDIFLPGFEILYLWNLFPSMQKAELQECLDHVEATLSIIYKREKKEYQIRTFELMPDIPPPDYYDQRAILLLIKAHILNCLGQSNDAIAHLNWIVDHKDRITYSTWVLPYTYWESGVVSWYTGGLKRARSLWEQALACTGYDFEYRLAIKLNLAVHHAIDIGVPETPSRSKFKGHTSFGRKRLPVAEESSQDINTTASTVANTAPTEN